MNVYVHCVGMCMQSTACHVLYVLMGNIHPGTCCGAACIAMTPISALNGRQSKPLSSLHMFHNDFRNTHHSEGWNILVTLPAHSVDLHINQRPSNHGETISAKDSDTKVNRYYIIEKYANSKY